MLLFNTLIAYPSPTIFHQLPIQIIYYFYKASALPQNSSDFFAHTKIVLIQLQESLYQQFETFLRPLSKKSNHLQISPVFIVIIIQINLVKQKELMINNQFDNSDEIFMQRLWGFSSIIMNSLDQNSFVLNNFKQDNFNSLQNSSYSIPQFKISDGLILQSQIFTYNEQDNDDSLESYLDYTKCRCRGKSQMYEESQDYNRIAFNQPPSENSTIGLPSLKNESQKHQKIQENISSNILSQKISEQDLISSNTTRNKITIGLQAKNVTKNIGNLLFKYIWKNRKILPSLMRIDQGQWNDFIDIFTVWRKRSNITRQFLISRWHGLGFQASIFRRISQHYFRKRCLTDIMKSNIGSKKIHYQRIYRFQLSIINAEGLSSIV